MVKKLNICCFLVLLVFMALSGSLGCEAVLEDAADEFQKEMEAPLNSDAETESYSLALEKENIPDEFQSEEISAASEDSALGGVKEQDEASVQDAGYKEYRFRNEKYLEQHFDKHGGEFSYADKEEYLEGANKVINDPNALHKTEKEDGDDIYFIESTNEFVVVSTDGYIRTYFIATGGRKYFDRQ